MRNESLYRHIESCLYIWNASRNKPAKGTKEMDGRGRKGEKVGHGGIGSHTIIKKRMLFFVFLFYETIYNPFSNSKIHSYNLPPRFSQKRFVNEICLEVFPLSSVQWTVCLLGCSFWMFSTMGLDDDSEQNPMVGTPQASSDNYYNHTIMVLQVDVFFHNTSRKLFTSGMMNDSQAQFRQILWCRLLADT